MQAREIASGPIQPEQMREWVREIARFLDVVGHAPFTAEFGWGTTLPMEELWQPFEIAPKDIPELVRESEEKGVFRVGGGDLIIRSKDGAINFTMCHDSDIHFVSSDEGLLEQVAASWRSKGWELYESPYVVAGRREWTKME